MPYADLEDARENDRRRYRAGPTRREKALARSRKPETKQARRDHDLKKSYGLTRVQYNEMLAEQSFTCAVCGGDNPGRDGDWCVDHCHKTNRVRGLLCLRCNFALGHLRDDPSFCRAMAAYLER